MLEATVLCLYLECRTFRCAREQPWWPVRAPRWPPQHANRHTAPALQLDLRSAQRCNRGRMSCGRPRREARAAGRQQKSQFKSGQLILTQHNSTQRAGLHLHEESCGPARRPRGGGASRRLRSLARSTNACDTADGCAACAGHPCERRPLRPAPATRRPLWLASTAH